MLAERGSRYGAFKTHAEHTQAIKRLLIKLMGRAKWDALADDQREALEMIAHKLGRITNGDPNYDDSWRDVAGYADLVAKRLANPAPEVKTEAETETETEAKAKADTPSYKIGDKVRIASTINADLYKICPGFYDDMATHLGHTGTVISTDPHRETACVKFSNGAAWWWRTQDLTLAAPESQAKTDKTSECDCPACKIRRLLQSDEVTVILDAEVEDDEHSLRSFIQTFEEVFKKS